MVQASSQGGDSSRCGRGTWALGPLPDLPAQLHTLLAQVPAGCLVTYGDLAVALGGRAASRWVAQELAGHQHDDYCRCHRVVRATGELGNYRPGGGQQEKAVRLAAEGLEIDSDGAGEYHVDLPRYRLPPLVGSRSLETLQARQEAIEQQIELAPLHAEPRLIGGLDVSYPAAGRGVAAYALVDAASGELVWSLTREQPVRFPYITSFLSFREVPILLELLQVVRDQGKLADVILVDGAGIMHPRGAGHAAHLGVLTDLPTIGVTKKLLFGRVDLQNLSVGEPREVTAEDRVLGAAIRPRATSQRPIFVSPGHRVDVASAVEIVVGQLRGRRLPEAIYWADRLSRQGAP